MQKWIEGSVKKTGKKADFFIALKDAEIFFSLSEIKARLRVLQILSFGKETLVGWIAYLKNGVQRRIIGIKKDIIVCLGRKVLMNNKKSR